MTGKIIEEDPGEVVAGTVDEAAGISIPEGESGSKFFRCVYFANHDMIGNLGRRLPNEGRKWKTRWSVLFDVLHVELKRLDSFCDHQNSRDHEQLEAATG